MNRISKLWQSTRCVAALTAGALLSSACVTNPVTGKSEISLISAQQELALGAQNYLPMQQSQGGIFRLDPAVNAYVSEVGHRVAAMSPRALPYEFVVLNNSVPNAWALPGGKIAINRGLLIAMQSEAELAAVLSHEVVHAAAKHSAQQMQRGMLLQVLVLGTAIITSDSDYGALAVGGANIGAQLLSQSYSRKAELESDYYGMQYMSDAGYNPQGAVDLQETLLRMAKERGQSGGFSLFSSHPPSQQRLATNTITASALPPGGKIGEAEYAAAMRTLFDTRAAYDAYDAGREALAARDFTTAAAKAREAITAQPREAAFHALLGDSALVQNNYDSAIRSYTDALSRDATFFYYHLQRGIARQRRGDLDGAESDLQASIKLFETAPAYLGLGQIAMARNDRAAARQYFAAAAGGSGVVADTAKAELMRLDLASNPGDFLPLRTGIDGNGQLLVAINNPNPLAVRGIRVEIRYLDASGQTRTLSRNLSGVLAAGQATTVATGLGPFSDSRQYQVQLLAAALAE